MVPHLTRLLAAAATLTFLLGTAPSAQAALPVTTHPELTLARVLQTAPFTGSSVSAKDNEGSAYVARDDSLWLADDDGRAIYEVSATTGALKRVIDRNQLAAATRFGGTGTAGLDRSRDLESLAYDRATDTLYAFSGSCCTATVLPAAYRLTRRDGVLELDSFQPLPPGSDFTASDWNAADQKIYVGISRDIRTYDYPSNTVGPTFQVAGLSGIEGFDFSADGADLFVARSPAQLSRVDWATRSMVPGWTFDLTGFGVLDARGAALVGDQLYVSDGYDFRTAGDPVNHAVFVFDVTESVLPASAPTASFTATATSGPAPLSVTFTDTSTGAPASWAWTFGDGQTAGTQNPTHVFTDPGTYTVKLTASNAAGSTMATGQVTVSPGATTTVGDNLVANPGFEQDLAGWDAGGVAGSTLSRVEGGHTGSWAARLTNTSTAPVTVSLNDSPNTVATSRAGTYAGSAWVRSDTAGAKLYLRVREYKGSTKVSEKIVAVTLSTQWQQVSATLTPVSPGTTSIEVATAVYSAAPNASYYVDDVELAVS